MAHALGRNPVDGGDRLPPPPCQGIRRSSCSPVMAPTSSAPLPSSVPLAMTMASLPDVFPLGGGTAMPSDPLIVAPATGAASRRLLSTTSGIITLLVAVVAALAAA